MHQSSSHQDNKRLFGFVLQSGAAQCDNRAVCYIFESNNEGEKVVCVTCLDLEDIRDMLFSEDLRTNSSLMVHV